MEALTHSGWQASPVIDGMAVLPGPRVHGRGVQCRGWTRCRPARGRI